MAKSHTISALILISWRKIYLDKGQTKKTHPLLCEVNMLNIITKISAFTILPYYKLTPELWGLFGAQRKKVPAPMIC